MRLSQELTVVLQKVLKNEDLSLIDKKVIEHNLAKSEKNKLTKEDFTLVVKTAMRLNELFQQFLE